MTCSQISHPAQGVEEGSVFFSEEKAAPALREPKDF
jgi:hypothetical protein